MSETTERTEIALIPRSAAHGVCAEILDIVREYRRQTEAQDDLRRMRERR